MRARLLTIVVALWAGSLVTVCALVAPLMFSFLQDRHVAGELAGHLFSIESRLGGILGAIALILLVRGPTPMRARPAFALIVATGLAPLISEFALRPFMDNANNRADMQTFAALHAVAAGLFGLACVTALALLWRISQQAK